MQQATVRKVFKCVAGVLNNAFGADEAKKCEAELKEVFGAEFEDSSFPSVCRALSKAIDAGLVPEQGLQTLRNLASEFEKHGLEPGSALPRSLGLSSTLTLNVVNMAGEKASYEVQALGRVVGLKSQLAIPFGKKANLTFKDTLLQDSQTFADAGVVDGSDLLCVQEEMSWEEGQQSAMKDLLDFLDEGEEVEAVVFGDWGWGGYEEVDEAVRIPEDRREKVLSPYEAGSYMEGWSFLGGHGAPECYAVYVYTNQRVIFVSQYDGATNLEGIPLRPMACKPSMPGG